MSRAEFEDYLVRLDEKKSLAGTTSPRDDTVEVLIANIKSGSVEVEDLTLDQMKLICNIGWDIGKRCGSVRPPLDPFVQIAIRLAGSSG